MAVSGKRDRLFFRSDEYALLQNLNQRYNLSIAAAEKLSEELADKYLNDNLLDGMIWYTAIDIGELAGKPIKDCQKKRIKLTLLDSKDLEIEEEFGLARLRFEKVVRLCWEAYNQGALLTQEDLARLLNMSVSGVKKIVKQHKQEENLLPTRGYYHDIGPGISHKYEAVRLFLRGMTLSDIAWRIHHCIWSVERYIRDFCVVFMAHCEGYTPERISHMARLSIKLVREYISLYRQFCTVSSNLEFLRLIEIRLAKMIVLKKPLGGA